MNLDFIGFINYNGKNKLKGADKMTVTVYEQHNIITRSAVLPALI